MLNFKNLIKGLWQLDKFLLPAGIGDLIAYLDSLGLPEHGGIGLVLKKNRVSSPHTHVESGALYPTIFLQDKTYIPVLRKAQGV